MIRNSIRALVWSALLIAPLAATQGCSSVTDAVPGGNPLDALCCKDFQVGADLGKVDWGVEGEAKATFSAFMQATGDFSAAATATVTDLGNACKALAVDLGAEDKETETEPGLRAKAWCAMAAATIKGKAGGSISIDAQPASCSFSASASASCEGSCSANAMCSAELGDVKARCEPGKLSGKCTGECKGSCEGSASVAVECTGKCEGECSGTCDGVATNGMGSASCAGECKGECRGTCTASAGAMVNCTGSCSGECSVEFQAPKCKAELTPPSAMCSGSADCSGSCKASASAKAECTPPSISIKAAGTLDAAAIASIKAHLPDIVLIIKVRGELLLKNAQVVASVGANVGGKIGADPKGKAVLCLVPALAAIGQAVGNAQATVDAAGSITGSVSF
jgi:hypothetical protein